MVCVCARGASVPQFWLALPADGAWLRHRMAAGVNSAAPAASAHRLAGGAEALVLRGGGGPWIRSGLGARSYSGITSGSAASMS